MCCQPSKVVEEGLPSTNGAWRSFATNLVRSDDLSQRNLAFRDEARKAEIRDEELAKMPPSRRMHLARTGELEPMLETLVSARLEAGQ